LKLIQKKYSWEDLSSCEDQEFPLLSKDSSDSKDFSRESDSKSSSFEKKPK